MHAETDRGSALVARALVPYNQKPGEVEIAALVDDLIRHGEGLLAHASRYEASAVALGDWHRLTTDGPTDSPMGNWNHARALARTIRTLRRVSAEQ